LKKGIEFENEEKTVEIQPIEKEQRTTQIENSVELQKKEENGDFIQVKHLLVDLTKITHERTWNDIVISIQTHVRTYDINISELEKQSISAFVIRNKERHEIIEFVWKWKHLLQDPKYHIKKIQKKKKGGKKKQTIEFQQIEKEQAMETENQVQKEVEKENSPQIEKEIESQKEQQTIEIQQIEKEQSAIQIEKSVELQNENENFIQLGKLLIDLRKITRERTWNDIVINIQKHVRSHNNFVTELEKRTVSSFAIRNKERHEIVEFVWKWKHLLQDPKYQIEKIQKKKEQTENFENERIEKEQREKEERKKRSRGHRNSTN